MIERDMSVISSAPDWADVVTMWSSSPVTDVLVAAGTVGYLLLVRRVARGGAAELGGPAQRWPRRRSVSWLLAMVTLVLALDSAVSVYGDVLFWVHMVQHLLLIMVAPVLLVWAQPWRLVRSVIGPRVRAALDGVVGSRGFRWATGPLAGLALYAAVVVLTHLTGFQQLSATHEWVRAGESALYLASGYLLFLPLAGSELGAWSVPYPMRFVVLALSMGVDTLTGVALMLTSRPLAPVYAAAHPGWGPDALADQQVAGAIMWWGGDALMMALMIVVGVQWGLAGEDRQGLGGWVEGARRRALLGDDTDGIDTDALGTGVDVDDIADMDDDQRALQAYNAMLAELHGRSPPDEDRRRTGTPAPPTQQREQT